MQTFTTHGSATLHELIFLARCAWGYGGVCRSGQVLCCNKRDYVLVLLPTAVRSVFYVAAELQVYPILIPYRKCFPLRRGRPSRRAWQRNQSRLAGLEKTQKDRAPSSCLSTGCNGTNRCRMCILRAVAGIFSPHVKLAFQELLFSARPAKSAGVAKQWQHWQKGGKSRSGRRR